MKFERLSGDSCPICGCSTVVEESVNVSQMGDSAAELLTHVNGGKWENRKFLCGQVLSYIPNFCKTMITGNCRNDPEWLNVVAGRKKAKEAVMEYIQNIPDIEETLRKTMTDSIRSIHVGYPVKAEKTKILKDA